MRGRASAGIDDEGCAVDEAGFVGGEEADGSGDVLGFTNCAGDFFGATFDVGIIPEHGGIDGARGDPVTRHTLLVKRMAKLFSDAVKTVLPQTFSCGGGFS